VADWKWVCDKTGDENPLHAWTSHRKILFKIPSQQAPGRPRLLVTQVKNNYIKKHWIQDDYETET